MNTLFSAIVCASLLSFPFSELAGQKLLTIEQVDKRIRQYYLKPDPGTLPMLMKSVDKSGIFESGDDSKHSSGGFLGFFSIASSPSVSCVGLSSTTLLPGFLLLLTRLPDTWSPGGIG